MFKFNGEPLPEWLVIKLNQLSPSPNINTLFGLLLEDYIKRNDPCPHDFSDPSKAFCVTCGVKE